MCIREMICQRFFFFKQKTAYEIMPSLVGSEMCIRDSFQCLLLIDTSKKTSISETVTLANRSKINKQFSLTQQPMMVFQFIYSQLIKVLHLPMTVIALSPSTSFLSHEPRIPGFLKVIVIIIAENPIIIIQSFSQIQRIHDPWVESDVRHCSNPRPNTTLVMQRMKLMMQGMYMGSMQLMVEMTVLVIHLGRRVNLRTLSLTHPPASLSTVPATLTSAAKICTVRTAQHLSLIHI
eukprot:TRINITY_DN3945_c0_g1_i18.p1 TRINITY_DN3945_c0_g1~~TRINITY_DN3945_c0_g1_i18.p1  ORF type:complete len:235 (-),score=18.31 TRINITY_DN3945_c0_g1_i18:101-805(-)